MTPAQKRKAVETALMPFIHGQTLAQALILWDEKYAHKPNFALQHFLRELCSDIELAHMRSRMLQALVTTFSSLQDQRQEKSPAKTNHTSQAAAHHSPEQQMFMALVEQLINSAKSDRAIPVRLYVLEHIEKLPTAPNNRRALQTWLNQIAPLTDITLNLALMQQVINLAYVGLCEYLGPITADQLLQESVSAVQQSFPQLRVQSLL